MVLPYLSQRTTSPATTRKSPRLSHRKPEVLRRALQCERLEDRLAPSLNPSPFQLDRNALQNVPVVTTATDDWNNVLLGGGGASYVNTGVIADPYGTTIFTTGGSKDDLDVPNWRHTTGAVPDKDEITNAYAAAYFNTGRHLLYFGADRFANNGDATIGFWFFKNPVSIGPNGTFVGVHDADTDGNGPDKGDILIVSDFSRGGRISTIRVYKWVGTGGDATANGTLANVTGGSGADCSTAAGMNGNICATVNDVDQTSPWPYTPKAGTPGIFPRGSLFEGGINLSALGLSGCFSSFLSETRSSTSVDAQLKDFVLGRFAVCDARINVPSVAINEVGSPHSVPFTVLKQDASTNFVLAPAAGVTVTAQITSGTGSFVGGNTCVTNGSGTCSVSIVSPNVGSVVVSGSATGTFADGSTFTRTTNGQLGNSNPFTKHFVNANISISPSAVNEVGQPHTFTATMTASAPAGVTTAFGNLTITASNGATVTCTNASTCSLTVNSPTATIITANAYGSVAFSAAGATTLTVNRDTDPSTPLVPAGPGGSGPAVKRYVDANISIGPDGVNRVGQPHTFTVTVMENDGSGGFAPAAGETVTATLANSNGATASFVGGNSCVTGALGTCTLTINSPTTGLVTVNASAGVSVSGLTLNRSTTGAGGNSGPASKRYVDARIAINNSAVNRVGQAHTFTVNVMEDQGDGNGFVAASGETVTGTLSNGNGATGSFVGGNSCTTNGGGTCTLTVNSLTTGVVTISAAAGVGVQGILIPVSTDGQGLNSGPATKRYVDAKIAINNSAVNRVGQAHTFTVTVMEDQGDGAGFVAASGETVLGALSNSNGATGSFQGGNSCTTNGGGTCTLTVNSPTTGVVTVSAAAAVGVQGITVPVSTDGQGLNSNPATKRYVDAKISINNSAVNRVGQAHTFTVTVMEDQGDGSGFVAAAGETVTGTLSNSNGAMGSFVGGNSCTTNGGTCTLTVNSPTTGLVTVSAASAVGVQGIVINVATDGAGLNSGPADKRYVDAKIAINNSAVNRVGQAHTFTVTVMEDQGDGNGFVAASGETVTGTLSNSFGATGSFVGGNTCTTNGSGTCTLTVNSPTTGLVTVSGAAGVSVQGITVNVVTDGTGLNSSPADKRYVDAKIAIGTSAVNRVGQAHTFTVTVMEDNGTGGGFVAASGETVTGALSNSNGATGSFVGGSSCTTNGGGTCTLTVNSPTTGLVTVNAAATVSVGGITVSVATDGTGLNSGPADKRYVDARISIAPNAVNGVGEPHTFTVTVMEDAGTGAGFVAASGETVTATLSGAGSFVGGSSCTTNGGGTCTLTVNSNVAGTATVSAAATVGVGGITVGVATDGTGLNSGPATKQWIAGSLVWSKVDGRGVLLGGATFQACRTHDRFGVDIADQCTTVLDNTGADADTDAGEFRLNNLALGRWTIRETIPPFSYRIDTTVVTLELTLASPNGVSGYVWVNLGGEGCTPGYWRNKEFTWDQLTDATPAAMPAGLKFTTATLFNAYFGLTPAQSGFANSMTMLQGIELGGGDANKLARHGIAALLNVAAGINYQLPAGINNFTQLRTALRNAFINQTYEPLATQLADSNNLDHQRCPSTDGGGSAPGGGSSGLVEALTTSDPVEPMMALDLARRQARDTDDLLWIDQDAAGFGWFADPTPAEDMEFADVVDGSLGQMDLPTVSTDELGNLLGW